MEYRRFGRTELQMPVLSCGGMRYQYKWKDVPFEEVAEESQKNLEETIHHALELGINHIETARGYGTSELQLGNILPGLPRDEIIVQSKVVPFPKVEKFRKVFNRSFENLKLDYWDLFGFHGVNTHELIDTVFESGCYDEALAQKEQGKIRNIGLSTHGPLDVILRAIETDKFDYINLHWYFINQTNWPAVEAARKHDMGVFIISPTDKGGHLYNPPQRLTDLCAPLSPIVFNDLFCLSHPEVHTLSIGAARATDFDEHVKVLDHLADAAKVLPPILKQLEQGAIERLGEDWVKTWDQGLPPIEKTPGEINIAVMLWLRNLLLAYDMEEYAKARYNLFGNAAHWFPGAKPDTVEELDLTECLAASPHKEKIPGILAEIRDTLAGKEVQRLSQET